MNRLYKPPSRYWGWALYGIVTAITAVNILFLIRVFQEGNRERVAFAVAFSFMMAAWYLLFGYHYLQWAASRKAELHEIAILHRNLLFERYNRIFINEHVCSSLGLDPLRFKRLRQVDLREVLKNQRRY